MGSTYLFEGGSSRNIKSYSSGEEYKFIAAFDKGFKIIRICIMTSQNLALETCQIFLFVGFLYSLLFWIKWAVFPESWIINGSVKSEKNCQFKLKFWYAKFSDGVQFFCSRLEILFVGQPGPKIKIICLNWNFVPSLIRICRIQ